MAGGRGKGRGRGRGSKLTKSVDMKGRGSKLTTKGRQKGLGQQTLWPTSSVQDIGVSSRGWPFEVSWTLG